MKNFLVVLLFIILAFFVSGQATYNDSREDFLAAMQRSKSYRTHIAAMNISLVRTFRYKHTNADGYLMYEAKYDDRGNCTDWVTYKHGKVKTRTSSNHDDSNRLTQSAFYKGANKFKNMVANTYDKAGNLIEQDVYWKNPKTATSKIIKSYDNQNKITESKTFGKKGNLTGHIEYTYYGDGSKKQTTQYSAKGKVKRIWNFDCNPVGKLEAKKFKDTSKICIHYETDKDSNPIKVKEEYNGAGLFGGNTRSVTKYNKDNNVIDETYYKLNGKQIYHWSTSYNSSEKITEHIVYKPGTQETWFRTIYTYNSDGNMATSITYKKSQLPFSTMKYVYTSSISAPAK